MRKAFVSRATSKLLINGRVVPQDMKFIYNGNSKSKVRQQIGSKVVEWHSLSK